MIARLCYILKFLSKMVFRSGLETRACDIWLSTGQTQCLLGTSWERDSSLILKSYQVS